MKITFIRPRMSPHRAADTLEPLVFAILAALTPPDVEISFYDDRIEALPYDQPTDLVVLTVETFTARRAYHIAARFRQRRVPVVMGGYHPTLLPDEARQHADAVVTGDAENIWPIILEDARSGRLQPIYHAPAQSQLPYLLPDRRIFHGKRYLPITLIQYGRGCRFACDFCAIHAFYGARLARRPLEVIAAEIAQAGRKYVLLVDDNLFVDEAHALALCDVLAPLKVHWACQVSIDVARNGRLLDRMARSGCFAVFIGLESLNAANLQQMRKNWSLQCGDYASALQEFYRRGLMVCASFVFGYDHDTPDVFERTLDFALRSKLTLAQFNPLIPMPATPLFQRLQAEGRLIHPHWWLDEEYRYGQAFFHPKNMSAEELSATCYRMRTRFNTYPAILRRACAPQMNARSPHHLFAFLVANLVSRKEIHAKQGEALGLETD